MMKLIFCINYYQPKVTNLRKVFANSLLTNIKLSKTQISKKIQSGGFLGRLLGPLIKIGSLLMKNVLKPSVKSVLIQLGSTAAADILGYSLDLSYLVASLLGNMVAGKRATITRQCREAIRVGKETIGAKQGF